MPRLQPRDRSLFHALEEHGYLTRELITEHFDFFQCGDSALYRRLKKLVEAKYIGKTSVFNDGGKAYTHLYFLKPDGYEAIEKKPKKKKTPKNLFLIHAIRTIECGLIFRKIATQTPDLNLSWTDERQLVRLENGLFVRAVQDKFYSKIMMKEVYLVPDAVMILEVGKHKMLYFVELDNGTEAVRTQVVPKLLKYLDYSHLRGKDKDTKRFQERYGVNTPHFRVLFITTTQKRITNILRLSSHGGSFPFVFYTTLEALRNVSSFRDVIWKKREEGEVLGTGILR